jgi:hypothetical protein
MTARDVEKAAARLAERRLRIRHEVIAAAIAAILAPAVASFSVRLAVGLAVGAFVGGVIAALTWARRRELLESLALDPEAYSIPEVASLGSRVVAIGQREQLASWIRSLIRGNEQWLELHLPERTRTHAPELEAVAREISLPAAQVHPASAMACRRLLTHPVQSPLYNPNLPDEDLTAVLLRIRAGITSQATHAG